MHMYVVAVTYQQRHLSRTLCSTMESMDVASVSNLERAHEQRMVPKGKPRTTTVCADDYARVAVESNSVVCVIIM